MTTRIGLLAFFLTVSTVINGQQGLSVGDIAPTFKAPADNGMIWDINEYFGNNYIVIYFYPAAMTGGCTKQACSYRDHRDDLQKAGAIVVGISGDKTENLKIFKQAENLNFPLISDEKGEIAKAFGVPASEGGTIKRTFSGIEHDLTRGVTAKRWTFIIGKDKKIIYRNDAVDAEKDAEEILGFLKLQAGR